MIKFNSHPEGFYFLILWGFNIYSSPFGYPLLFSGSSEGVLWILRGGGIVHLYPVYIFTETLNLKLS